MSGSRIGRALSWAGACVGALLLSGTAQAGDGVLVGQTLSDTTSLPLPGASVRLLSGATATADLDGRYALVSSAGPVLVVVEKAGFVSVTRPAVVVEGAGSYAPDARLTPLAAPVTLGSAGGMLTAGTLTVTVPAGALGGDTAVHLTTLSGQGLPVPLPPGWSPLAAWDVRAATAPSSPLTARLTNLPAGLLHLVRHEPSQPAWVMVQPAVEVVGGVVSVELPEPGAYALLAADLSPAPPIAPAGGLLAGVPAVAVPNGLSATVDIEPVLVPSTGATARARIHLSTSSPLPSGLVIQARLAEEFTAGEEQIRDEERTQDVVVYRPLGGDGRELEGLLPLTALRSFPPEQSVEGLMHVEVWSREAAAAGMGGAQAVSVVSGSFQLGVGAGSLPSDTLVSIAAVGYSPFVPVLPGTTPLGEVVVDLGGAVLATPAELSLAAPGLSPGDTVVIARVERLDGVPYLSVVAMAEVVGGRAVSTTHPDLPGIVRGGRYVFFRLTSPVGLVKGTTSAAGAPVRAVVRAGDSPFAGISGTDGRYVTAGSVGSGVVVSARIPLTTATGSGTVDLNAAQTALLDLVLSGAPTTVTITPADGEQGVAVSASVELVASAPLLASSVNTGNLRLYKGDPAAGQAVSARVVVSQDRRHVALIPLAPLAAATAYTFQASGVRDEQGGSVVVPESHFTTRSDAAPVYDIKRLVFSFPDEEGVVQVRAAASSFPPGSSILILNYGNGVVLSLTVDNDGGLTGELPATLDDAMMVTLTDPTGASITMNVSRYVDVATGRTAVGAYGGVVEGRAAWRCASPKARCRRGSSSSWRA